VALSDGEAQPVSTMAEVRRFRPKQQAKQGRKQGGGSEFHKRPPLKAWEEYAHALLQANETSFLN
jgi:hypothetical protein